MNGFAVAMVCLGAIIVVLYVLGEILSHSNDKEAARLIADGKLDPDDWRKMKAAARHGRTYIPKDRE